MRAVMIHRDGKVIYRVPDPEGATGMDLSQNPQGPFVRFMATGQTNSVFEGKTTTAGENRLLAIREIKPKLSQADKSLVIALSRDLQSMYARWYAKLNERIVYLVSLSLVAALGLYLYQRRQRAYAELLNLQVVERQLADQKIKTSAENLQLAIDGARLGDWHWNIKTNQLSWSDACLAHFGLCAGEEMSYDRFLSILHPEDRERIAEAVTKSLASGDDYNEDFRVVWPDGSVHWINSVGRPFYAADQTPERMEGVVLNISERKDSELALAASRNMLEERNMQIELLNRQLEKRAIDAETATRAKTALLRNASHELRTPLNHILGGTNILLKGHIDKKQEKWLRTIEASSTDLLRLINEILDVANAEAGRIELELKEFSPLTVMHEVELMLAHRAQKKGLPLEVGSDENLPDRVMGDPTRLAQALLNYLDNAIKFTEQGQLGLFAHVLENRDQTVLIRFEVRDTGIGIAPDIQEKLFMAFVQGDDSSTRPHGGLGIGLANVKELAKLMGGEVGVESTPGTGSTFWLTARFAKPAQNPDV